MSVVSCRLAGGLCWTRMDSIWVTAVTWLCATCLSFFQQDNPGLPLRPSKRSKRTSRNGQEVSLVASHLQKQITWLDLKSKRRELFSTFKWEQLQSHVWKAWVQEGLINWGYSHNKSTKETIPITYIKNGGVWVAVGVLKSSQILALYGGQDDAIFWLTRWKVWEKEKNRGRQKLGSSKEEGILSISWSRKTEQ